MKPDGAIVRGAVAGFVGGLVASWIMNRYQAGLSRLFGEEQKSHGAQSLQTGSPHHGAAAYLQKHRQDCPEDDAAERTANLIAVGALDRPLSEDEKDLGGTIFHYAFGGTTGAIYGAAGEVLPQVTAGAGLPFGVAVWLLADEGVVPALGLSKAAHEYSFWKHSYAFTSHLIYGLTTEITRKALLQNVRKQQSERKQ